MQQSPPFCDSEEILRLAEESAGIGAWDLDLATGLLRGTAQFFRIMGLAAKKLIDLAFDSLGMNRVQIRCADANVRSAAIPRKLGFTEEGRQRQHVIRDGKIYDFLIFGRLRDEWERG